VAAHFAGAELGSAEPGPDAAALLEAQLAGFAAVEHSAAAELWPDGSAVALAAAALLEVQKAGFVAEFGPDGSAEPAAPDAVALPEAQKDAVLAPGQAMRAQEPRARANPGLACLEPLRVDHPVAGPAHCLRAA